MNMKTSPKIASCGPAALALVGGALGVNDSQAAIVYTPVTSGGTISSGGTLWFDLGEDGSGAWSSSSIPGADFNFQNSGGAVYSYAVGTPVPRMNVSGIYSVKMASGAPVDSGITTWQPDCTVAYTGHGNFPKDGTHGYLGLRVEPTVSAFKYGWAEISYNVDGSLTLYGFAVQTDGTSINTGQTSAVPEPAETGLVAALLAGGVAVWRRRQAFKRAA